ncbi:unnamed protein product [Dovyalis caffra]|uniref:Uncharacterized protein n=1 Tax=Dovyalis caffra TaxID=77055 RepID=A0AAV1QZT8_9ROSI|nr:unnamed protein product [Dovyalis caffra]
MSAPTPTADLLSPRLHRRKDVSMVTQDIRAKAEVYYGDETCRKKVMSLLTEKGLPSGLLIVLEEIEEHGYSKDTGFVWLKHRSKRKEYQFDKIAVCYDNEVTAYFEPNRIKNLTGVKAKDFLIWITLSEIHVNGNNPDALITFKTPAGFSKSFQLSLFTFKAEEEANEGSSGNVKTLFCSLEPHGEEGSNIQRKILRTALHSSPNSTYEPHVICYNGSRIAEAGKCSAESVTVG